MSSPQPPGTNNQPQKNARDTARTFNKFAKRDPALYPLAGIIGSIVVVAGFFFMSKADTSKGERKFAEQNWADRLSSNDSSLDKYKQEFKNAANTQNQSPSQYFRQKYL